MSYKTVVDQMNREVRIPEKPLRIISLVPSQTELLADLGLGKLVVGITKFCIHPIQWFDSSSPQAKTRIGGTKNINFEAVAALKPDLIIGNKEENSSSDIEYLEKKYPVWMSDIYTLEDALAMITQIGNITNTSSKATEIVTTLVARQAQCEAISKPKTGVYLIWNNPIMVAGKNTFIDDMLGYCGLVNAIGDERYPVLNWEKLKQINPEWVLLSSEPFPFNEEHVALFQKELPHSKVIIVDGELFSWYGSRLLNSFDYFTQLNLTEFHK